MTLIDRLHLFAILVYHYNRVRYRDISISNRVVRSCPALNNIEMARILLSLTTRL